MRKAINISALIFFIWLVLDTFNVLTNLTLFLIMGELPGTNISLSPTLMLSITTLAIGIIVFELVARHFGAIRYLRYLFLKTTVLRKDLPSRRFSRI